MSTLIYTIAQNGYDRTWARCIESQRRYAERIGADFVVVRRPRVVRIPALSAWLKVPLMNAALNRGYDWVAYIDADCEIQSDAPDFRESIGSSDCASVFMANGRSGRLNSGVMFARCNEQSKRFYSRVLDSATEEIPAEARAGLKYENGNIIHCATSMSGIEVIDVRWNNSYDPGVKGYIKHYTGPFRADYEQSLTERAYSTFMKKVVARPSKQPVKRDLDFTRALQGLVDDATRHHPEFGNPASADDRV